MSSSRGDPFALGKATLTTEETLRMTTGSYGYQQSYTLGNIYSVKAQPREGPPVRLGLIGAGSAAQGVHLPAFMRLRATGEPVHLVAVADPLMDRAKKVADQYGVAAYGDLDHMLARERLDGVIVATPDHAHASTALACLEKGLHVLVEKPFATDLGEALDVCRAAAARKRVLMTAFCKRYSAPYWEARRLVTEELGRPAMATMKMCQAWARDALLERQFCHAFDLLRFFLGEVTELQAVGDNWFGDRNQYPIDNVIVTLRFASGAIGTFYGSGSALSLKPWERLEVYGDRRWLSVEDQYEVRYYGAEDQPARTWVPAISSSSLHLSDFLGYAGEFRNFARAIRGEEEPLVTGWDGYRTLQIVHATRQSIDSRRWVSIAPADIARL
jgi:predicted dehydrogenase